MSIVTGGFGSNIIIGGFGLSKILKIIHEKFYFISKIIVTIFMRSDINGV
jgi:hypothetical protein